MKMKQVSGSRLFCLTLLFLGVYANDDESLLEGRQLFFRRRNPEVTRTEFTSLKGVVDTLSTNVQEIKSDARKTDINVSVMDRNLQSLQYQIMNQVFTTNKRNPTSTTPRSALPNQFTPPSKNRFPPTMTLHNNIRTAFKPPNMASYNKPSYHGSNNINKQPSYAEFRPTSISSHTNRRPTNPGSSTSYNKPSDQRLRPYNSRPISSSLNKKPSKKASSYTHKRPTSDIKSSANKGPTNKLSSTLKTKLSNQGTSSFNKKPSNIASSYTHRRPTSDIESSVNKRPTNKVPNYLNTRLSNTGTSSLNKEPTNQFSSSINKRPTTIGLSNLPSQAINTQTTYLGSNLHTGSDIQGINSLSFIRDPSLVDSTNNEDKLENSQKPVFEFPKIFGWRPNPGSSITQFFNQGTDKEEDGKQQNRITKRLDHIVQVIESEHKPSRPLSIFNRVAKQVRSFWRIPLNIFFNV